MNRDSLGLCGQLRQIVLALTLALTLPAALSAQRGPARAIRGIVIDSLGVRVPYTTVTGDGRLRLVADDSGRFLVTADSGRVVRLIVRRIGFREREISLPVVQDTTIEIVLARLAQSLAPQEITGQRRLGSLAGHGFYRRLLQRESGVVAGYFVTPEEIEQRRAYRATQLLEGVPGVRMTRMGPSGVFWVPLGVDRCPMSIYLDRVRLNSMSNRGAPVFIDEIVSSNSLSGIEVYTSAVKAPPEFQPLNGTCGVVLLWTK